MKGVFGDPIFDAFDQQKVPGIGGEVLSIAGGQFLVLQEKLKYLMYVDR